MLLAVISNNAAAEWVPVTSNEAFVIYADPATLRMVGNRVKIWSLFDHEVVQKSNGESYMSIKSQFEYDCKEEQYRTLYVSFHSLNMGEGRVVLSSNKPNPWSPVPPGSMTEIMWKISCRRQ